MTSLLRLPGFARLVAAYVLNELAWSVGTLALSVLVYRRTGSALGSASFFLCAQALPALFAPVLVARLDRGPPRVVLPSLYAGEAILFGVLAWFTHRFLLAPVLALALVDGTVALSARSLAAAARVQVLTPVDRLREGNALVNTLFSIVFLLGPLIGGGVVALGGTMTALVVNCGLFAVMAVTLIGSTPSVAPVAGSDEARAEETPSRSRLRAGLALVRSDRPIATLLGLMSVVYVFFTISIPVEVVYAAHTLHAGPGGYGGLIAAWGGGAVVGSVLFARMGGVSARALLSLFTAVMGVGLGVMALAPGIVVALVGAVIAGVANGTMSTGYQHEIQARSPASWVAVIASLAQGMGQLSPGIGIVVGGLLASLASTRVAFGVASTGCLVFAAVTVVVLSPRRIGGATEQPPSGNAAAA